MVSGSSQPKNSAFIPLLAALAIQLSHPSCRPPEASNRPAYSRHPYSHGDYPPLKSGDLVFRTGRDLMARMILSRGEASRFSHVGIIHLEQGRPYVIHAIPEGDGSAGGVMREPLTAFAADKVASDLGFYRFEGLSDASMGRAADKALSWVGRPFDARFEYSTDSHLYCTELVLKAYAFCIPDLKDRVAGIAVPLLQEPVFPPDHLRELPLLRPCPGPVPARSRIQAP